MQKLLIADATEAFPYALAEVMQPEYQVRICTNGKEALEILRSDPPDVMVMDLVLPGLDGVSLLKQTAREGITPLVLGVCDLYNEYLVEYVHDLPLAYIIRKPCDLYATADRVRDLFRLAHLRKGPAIISRKNLTETLGRMGIQPGRRGYDALRESILLMARDTGQSITKEVYPEVGKRLGGNGSQVEHAIRYLLHRVWEKRDVQVWERYFPPGGKGSIKCPPNKAFICRLAEELEMKQVI